MIYTGDKLREINFPLGAIGSGSVGLTGIGNLADREIFNRPAKVMVWDAFGTLKHLCEAEVVRQ